MINTPSETEIDNLLCKHWPAYSMQAVLVKMRLRDAIESAIAQWATPQPSPAAQGDALDAARWRRLVNASEMAFPVAAIADDPENGGPMLYGRKRMEALIDSLDEIPSSYADAALAAQGDTP